jgi:BON domain
MNEMLFATGSPVWAAMPSIGLSYQPMSVTNRPIGPVFNPPAISAGGLSPAPALSAPQNLPAPSYVPPYAFVATNPLTTAIGDASGLVTPGALLATVAMRRGQPQGPTNDHEVEEFIYDALDLLPGTADFDVRCESGRVTLTGVVQQKRIKRDIGEIAWTIPGIQDAQNNVSIAPRRRARAAAREAEQTGGTSARKQA